MTENPENKNIRQRIVDRMAALQITQKRLCDLTGLSKNQVHNITSGEREIHVSDLVPLAAALHCSPSYLLTGREETSRSALEETGLYQTTLNRLQTLKTRPDFDKIRETFDLLARYPSFVATLHAYLLEELNTITVTDPDTKQLKFIDVGSGEPVPENPNFPRLKYLPSEFARLQILDWLSIIRKKEQDNRTV